MAAGLLVARFDIDFLGSYNGESNVQRFTYNNYFGQGITNLTAPASGGTIVQGTLPPAYAGTQYFFSGPNSNTVGVSFDVDGFRVMTPAIEAALAANAAPEPASLLLAGIALLALAGVSARRRA